MQTIKRLFRNNYSGENIYSLATYNEGNWEYSKEFVPKIVNNQRFGGKAVVVGNGPSRKSFDLTILKRKKIQTYGCNALYRDFAPEFLVAVGQEISNEIKRSGYASNHVVYGTTDNILKYPNTFHLIPQTPNWNSGALAAYLSCFDGHSTVYLIGHDGIDTPGHANNIYADTNGYQEYSSLTDNFWALAMSQVFKTYNLVDFVLVNDSGRGYMPAAWFGHTNLRRINFREFVLECDL